MIGGQLFTGDSYNSNHISNRIDLATGTVTAVDITLNGLAAPVFIFNVFYDPHADTLYFVNANDGLYKTTNASDRLDVPIDVDADSTPPVLALPNLVIEEATSAAGAVVDYIAAADDVGGDGPITPDCEPASGAVFPLGTTTVMCTATDSSGNSSTGDFDVVVQDTTPPAVTAVPPSQSVLWPPNHRMVRVTIAAAAVDVADPSPVCAVTDIASNEPVSGRGAGRTAPDWQIVDATTVLLRAERLGGGDDGRRRRPRTGRIYTITVECVDASGNAATGTTTVHVPHDLGRRGDDDGEDSDRDSDDDSDD